MTIRQHTIVSLAQRLHKPVKLFAKRLLLPAEGSLLESFEQLSACALICASCIKHRGQDLLTQLRRFGTLRVHDPEIRRHPKLHRKRPHHTDHEAIQCAHMQTIERRQNGTQHGDSIRRGQRGNLRNARSLLSRFIRRGSHTQTLYHRFKDLASGFA